ncbi:dockerin type I domain-containing protein, partial [Pelagicoccus enzymogenes]|uniref:dockerin type I domain-containing protein n=1 Tax=Pelagicoccus enzymogenes TaxID=2773457 RepID=UPI00280C811C
ATDTTSPYGTTVAGLPDGEHTFTCELVDALGDSVYSGPVTAMVSAASASLELTGERGDVDGDGELAPSDLLAMRALIGVGSGDPGYDAAADLDGDTAITRNDYRLLYALLRSTDSGI